MKLSLEDFINLFGAEEKEIMTHCEDLVKSKDFNYHRLENDERDELIRKIISIIDGNNVPKAGESRINDWEEGWSENLKDYLNGKGEIEKLIPKYYKKNVPNRLNGDYVQPVQENFVLNVTRIFRSWIFQKFLLDVDEIHEFGCGTGWHLAYLASIFPDKQLYGYDWTSSSQKTLSVLANVMNAKIDAMKFNFFDPDYSIKINDNSGVFTFAALEQVGNRFGHFLEYLLKNKPKICVNIEPLHELYDTSHLSDYLALRYHKYRNYLDGYLTKLRELDSEGRIEIIKVHHQRFGNMYCDTHSYVVWRPL